MDWTDQQGREKGGEVGSVCSVRVGCEIRGRWVAASGPAAGGFMAVACRWWRAKTHMFSGSWCFSFQPEAAQGSDWVCSVVYKRLN